MKSKFFSIIAMLAVLFLLSCGKEEAVSSALAPEIPSSSVNDPSKPVVTGETIKNDENAACPDKVYSWINVSAEVLGSSTYGVVFSTDPSFAASESTEVRAKQLDNDNKYIVEYYFPIYTTIYYKAYLKYSNGNYSYGVVKSFLFEPDLPSGAVDLGLSVKWAACNLGASKPEEPGGYYQWAGTRDVTSTSIYLDCSNCPYHNGSSYSSGWTKYVPSNKSSYWSGVGGPDNKTVLDPEDDIAHVKLGGSWRMPTDAEWKELEDNCIWTWTNLIGYKVTSKKNGNSIFLPAVGARTFDFLYEVGSYGYYWSSSLSTDSPDCASYVYFHSRNVGRDYDGRCWGQSVRPVSE